ncbi:lysophospholipid acyltransferase family protein [Mangrovimonas spongiae]|uniref:lysophospholipid acyltransferase family protein n=1 Tax=Mangrovimonas spongiae TaxID=2494697 RepID=UPI001F0BA1C2|nr:lysophospholipid acyltransferase family protein [Mangrovimonas spongiae]
MKQLWLHTVRCYLRLGLFFYYKKIQVVKQASIPKDSPLLFLSNHQNALVDALLIATTSGRFTYFLTRASVFKKPLVAKFLKSVQMLPVFRVRDGWQTIKNNHGTFNRCTKLLSNNETVSLFPEGNHHINRTVRPLSKGFTRIVLETLKVTPDLNLKLVPIGLNYQDGVIFPDEVSLHYGVPINVKTLIKDCEDDQSASLVLKKKVQDELKTLTTHIPPNNYEKSLQRLQKQGVNFLYPEKVNAFITSGFKNYNGPKYKAKSTVVSTLFKWLLKLNLWLPFLVWRYYALPKIKEVEFVATFRFALAITLVPVWLLLVTCIIGGVFSWAFGGIYLLISLIITLLAVKL